MKTEGSLQQLRFKLGKKPFWMTFEQLDSGQPSVWQLGIRHQPPRSRTKDAGAQLVEITARRPLLTVQVAGESFPLFINAWERKRPGKFVISGARDLGCPDRKVSWRAEISVANFTDRIQIGLSVKIKIEPRMRQPVRVRLSIPVLIPDPLLATSEVAAIRDERAAIAWDMDTRNAVSYVAPVQALVGPFWDDSGEFYSVLTESSIGSRRTIEASLSFANVETGPEVKNVLLSHYARVQQPLLPLRQPWRITLLQTASQAVTCQTDKGSYEVQGMERAYFVPPGATEDGRRRSEFYAGYPYFSADASLALLNWYRVAGDETVARVAKLAARGVAADFPSSMSDPQSETNKGAVWDKLALAGAVRPGRFSGFDDEAAFSILTNGRVAHALFKIWRLTGEDIFQSMALNACRWLLLRQNASGYFGGERYRTNGEWLGVRTLAGVEAIPAFVEAFRATRYEVYIRAAWRIANHVMDEILPHHPAPSIIPMERGAPIDSSLALAAVIRAFYMLDAEAANKNLRRAIHLAGNRLLCFPFDRMRDPEFNYDGQWGGLTECAAAFLLLHSLERKPEQLHLALALVRAVPAEARTGWRSISAFLYGMLGLCNLIKDAHVDFASCSIKIGWRLFEPDTAARQYVTARSAGEQACVDHLSLVCRGDDTTLALVLTDKRIPAIVIEKNKRRPVVRDLITGQLVTGDIPVHKLPFAGQEMYGIYTISR